MRLSIRTKLIGNLIIAAALPLAVAILTLLTAGYHHQVRQKGASYHSEARHVAQNLSLITERQVSALGDLLVLTDLANLVARQEAAAPAIADPELRTQIDTIEARWSALSPDSPDVRPLLHNDLADRLRLFQHTHPLFAEVLLTDTRGRLIAATDKTSDYYQADEPWWQRAVRLKQREAWIEGLEFDESANVLSLDVCMPVRMPSDDSRAPPMGVVKAVLNVSPLFGSVPFLLSDRDAVREVVREDGRVLLRLLDEQFVPRSDTILPEAMQELQLNPAGWAVTRLNGTTPEMVGIAPLRLFGVFTEDAMSEESHALFLIVRRDANAVLAPVRKQLVCIAVLGSLVAVGSVWLGIWLAGRHFVQPLEILRNAARTLAATARGAGPKPPLPGAGPHGRTAAEMVQRVRGIRTGDELEGLGQDFARMAEGLLHYQEELETNVATAHSQLHQAQRMKAIGTLAVGVAHEVKNPLQILLLGMTDLSTRLRHREDDLQHTLQEMRDAVDRANTIIDSLLDFSKLATLDLHPTSLPRVLDEALRLQHFDLMKARVQLHTTYERDLPKVPLDKQRMERVFVSVIENAIGAMPHGGRLTIRAYSRPCGFVDYSSGLGDTSLWQKGDPLVIVEVEDTGEGVPQQLLPRIFEPFFTTKAVGQGAGLGLSVAQNIISLHGGTIRLENCPAQGARVTIKLRTKLSRGRQQMTPSGQPPLVDRTVPEDVAGRQ